MKSPEIISTDTDEKKAKRYWELAAIGGDVDARHNLAVYEGNSGNKSRAMKHLMIASGVGDDDALDKIRECFTEGNATKDDFAKALRAPKKSKDAMKSAQREAAAAFVAQNNVGWWLSGF